MKGMIATTVATAATLLLCSARAAQIPFHNDATPAPTTLSHPSFPAHSLRIQRPDASFCETSGSRSWSGYLDVNVDKLRHEKGADAHPKGITEHNFFWAFESRNDPKNDPVLLWLNGGPGCSSFTSLMENAPCLVNGEGGTTFNPFAWNSNATVILLDQPIGVGFSYSDWTHPEKHNKTEKVPARARDTPSAAKDTSAFLHLLALHAKDVFGSDAHPSGISSFHMSGESYAGRYLPLIASQILQDNEHALKHPNEGIEPLPLESVLLGNGFVSPRHQYKAFIDFPCQNRHGWGKFVSDEECKQMYEDWPMCEALVEKCNVGERNDAHDVLACKLAEEYCNTKLGEAYERTGRSPYDFNKYGEYEEQEWLEAFFNKPSTQRALGVDAHVGDGRDGKFTGCSDAVFKHFGKTGDGSRSSVWAVQELLARGIAVLVYEGNHDWICNFEGAEAWTLDMDWEHAEEYRRLEKTDWYENTHGIKGDLAGRYKTAGNLSFVEIDSAGHFVPHDQPRAALSMLNYWLHGKERGHMRAQ